MPTVAVPQREDAGTVQLHLPPLAAGTPAGATIETSSAAAAALPGLHAPTPRATSEPSLAATFSVDSTHMPEVPAALLAAEQQVTGLPPAPFALPAPPLPLPPSQS